MQFTYTLVDMYDLVQAQDNYFPKMLIINVHTFVFDGIVYSYIAHFNVQNLFCHRNMHLHYSSMATRQ